MKTKPVQMLMAIIIALSILPSYSSVAAQAPQPVAGVTSATQADDPGPAPEPVKYPAVTAGATVQAVDADPLPIEGLVCASDVRLFDEPTNLGGSWWYSSREIFDWKSDDKFNYLEINVPPGQKGWVRAASGVRTPPNMQKGILRYRIRAQTQETGTVSRDFARIRILNKDTLELDGSYQVISNLDAGKGWFEREMPFTWRSDENITFEVYVQQDSTLQTTFQIGYAFLTACGPFENADLSVFKANTTFTVPRLYVTGGCQLWNRDGSPYVGEIESGSEFVCDSEGCTIPFGNTAQASTSAAGLNGPPNPGPAAEQCRGPSGAASLAVRAVDILPRVYMPMMGKISSKEEIVIAYFKPGDIPAGVTTRMYPWQFWSRTAVSAAAGSSIAQGMGSPSQLPGDFNFRDFGRLVSYLTLHWNILQGESTFSWYERWQWVIRYWRYREVRGNQGFVYEGVIWDQPYGPAYYHHTSARPSMGWPTTFRPVLVAKNPDGTLSVAVEAENREYAAWLNAYGLRWIRVTSTLQNSLLEEFEAASDLADTNRRQMNIVAIPLSYIMAQQLTADTYRRQLADIGDGVQHVIEPAYTLAYDLSVKWEGQIRPEWMGFVLQPVVVPVPVP